MLRPPLSLYSGWPQTLPIIPAPHLEEIAKHPYNVGMAPADSRLAQVLYSNAGPDQSLVEDLTKAGSYPT